MNGMTNIILDVKGLKTYFFTFKGIIKAVDGVDLKISENEAVGLIGESGCGKSTVAFSIVRAVPNPGRIIEGEIRFRDKSLLELTENELRAFRGSVISMVCQNPKLYLNPVMKVGDQIIEGIVLHQGLEYDKAKTKAIENLELVQIPSASKVIDYYPYQLSGGMCQRVMIAMALSCRPSLVITDEPTTALDVTIQAQILDLIKDLKEQFKTSLLIISHDLGVVSYICDRVYVMYAGKVVEYGDIISIYEKPVHRYTQKLLESILTIDKPVKRFAYIPGTVPNLLNPPSGCRFHPRCDRAKKICAKEDPPPFEVEPGHIVWCWFAKEI